MTDDRNKRIGFTLIEFLLGFLIFSVIAAALYGTFSSGLKIQKRANTENLLYHQIKMGLDMMARELESAISFDFSRSNPDLKAFEAGQQKFSFLLVDHDQIKRVTYYVQRPDAVAVHKVLLGQRSRKNTTVTNSSSTSLSSLVLMRSEEPLTDLVQGRSDVIQQEVVFDHIDGKSLKILYAYVATVHDKPVLQWQSAWDKDYLPAGVRLQMTFVLSGQGQKTISIEKDIYIPTGFWGEAS